MLLLSCRFIWITGWSVWTDTMLKRVPASNADSPSLGELLVQKANEKVKVRAGIPTGQHTAQQFRPCAA